MKPSLIVALLGSAVLCAGCATPAGWSTSDALAANKLEIQVGSDGRWGELEYHIDPSQVPEAVRAKMNELHPGGPFTGAEKEREGGVLYFELSRVVNGMEVEAMFLPDGTLHSEEIQVAEDQVPAAVRKAALGSLPGGKADQWEEIRNGQRQLVEYHVKLGHGKLRYKLIVSLDGVLLRRYREIPAELEVPADA